MDKSHIILIKLGGSIITDKSKESTPDLSKIEQLSQEISDSLKDLDGGLVIAHGAGSFGHPQAKKYRTAEGYIDQESRVGFALVRQAVTSLNQIVIDHLIRAGVPAVTYSPMSFINNKDQKPTAVFVDPIETLIDRGMVPVVHGDVITDQEKGWSIFSGETILNLLAAEISKKGYLPTKVIEVGATAGVYDQNGQTIKQITNQNFTDIEQALGGSEHADVTGGMLHKVHEALDLAKFGVPTYLISAKPGNLLAVISNDDFEGTRIS